MTSVVHTPEKGRMLSVRRLVELSRCVGRWLYRGVGRRTPDTEPLTLRLLREATDCERRARDYDVSDPYLAGVNSGRAEILRRWASSANAAYQPAGGATTSTDKSNA